MIFLLTFVLAIKRLFGFLVTLVLIICALISGYVILNHQIVRDFIHKEYKGKQTEREIPQKQVEPKENPESEKEQTEKFKKEITEVYESVKVEVERLLQKVQDYLQKSEIKKEQQPDQETEK